MKLFHVTILILVDGFLQFEFSHFTNYNWWSHNPYFSRWFSAIIREDIRDILEQGHNPYFSRWFSAICNGKYTKASDCSHNPYFSRWFSAIPITEEEYGIYEPSQSLF